MLIKYLFLLMILLIFIIFYRNKENFDNYKKYRKYKIFLHNKINQEFDEECIEFNKFIIKANNVIENSDFPQKDKDLAKSKLKSNEDIIRIIVSDNNLVCKKKIVKLLNSF